MKSISAIFRAQDFGILNTFPVGNVYSHGVILIKLYTGKSSWLFTGALFNGYNPPDGYCFDTVCGDDPVMDDPKLIGYNLDKKIDDFLKIAQQWATPYRTNHVQMTMGSDFQYMAAPMWFKNMDKLIR